MGDWVKIFTKKEDAENFKKFIERYDLVESFVCNESSLNRPQASMCRFCGCGSPKVTFRQKCHLVPQVLGNKYSLSPFECDSCNKKFGRYETNFHNFLGAGRLLNELHDNKTKTFSSVNNALTFKNNTKASSSPHMLVRRNNDTDSPFKLEGDRLEIKYETGSYVPLSIYKSFVKIALSLIDDKECQNYKQAFRFLTTKLYDNGAYKRMYKIMQHQFEFGVGFDNLLIELFKKKNDKEAIPTHHFIIHYKNYVFQGFIPFHKQDMKLDFMDIYFTPPFYVSAEDVAINVYSEIIDLSSTEKIKEETSLSARIDPTEFEKAVSSGIKIDIDKL